MPRKPPAIPSGFTVTPAEGGFGSNHNFEIEPLLVGKCVRIETISIYDEEKEKKVKRLKMTVQKADGSEAAVWESFMLSGLFKRKPLKRQIYIRYEGQRKMKGKKRLNIFSCGVK